MSREIKFRAWDGELIRYDITGFEHGEKNEMSVVFIDGDTYLIDEANHSDSSMSLYPSASIMQYTGLKDKNEIDIYEGDIVSDINGKAGLIKWFDSDACFEVVDLIELTMNGIGVEEPAYEMDISKGWVTLEIIGNIHQTPELLR